MHVAVSYLHSFAVPQCPLAAQIFKEVILLDYSFTDPLGSVWFSSCPEELKPRTFIIKCTNGLRHSSSTQAIGPYCKVVPYRGEIMAQEWGSPNPPSWRWIGVLWEDWSWDLLDPVVFGDRLSWSCEVRVL